MSENKESGKGKNGGMNGAVKGFTEFLSKYSIVTLAVGMVIGQTTRDVVNSLVTGIISPLISILFKDLIPTESWAEYVIEISETEVLVGQFVNALIQMVIIMFIIYLVLGVIFKRKDIIDGKKSR